LVIWRSGDLFGDSELVPPVAESPDPIAQSPNQSPDHPITKIKSPNHQIAKSPNDRVT
jgi:hypothetical protein